MSLKCPATRLLISSESTFSCCIGRGAAGDRTITQRCKSVTDKFGTWRACQLRHPSRRGHLHKGLRVLAWLPWAPAEKKRAPAKTRKAGCRPGTSAQRPSRKSGIRAGSPHAFPRPHHSRRPCPPQGSPSPRRGRAPGREPARTAGTNPAPRATLTLTRAAGAPPFPRERGRAPRPLRTRRAQTESAAAGPDRPFRFPRAPPADVTSTNNSGRQSCPGRSRGGGGLGLPAEAPSLGLSARPRRQARAAPPARRGPRTEAGRARRGGGWSEAGTGRARGAADGRAAWPIGSRGSGSGPMRPGGGTRRAAVPVPRERGGRAGPGPGAALRGEERLGGRHGCRASRDAGRP